MRWVVCLQLLAFYFVIEKDCHLENENGVENTTSSSRHTFAWLTSSCLWHNFHARPLAAKRTVAHAGGSTAGSSLGFSDADPYEGYGYAGYDQPEAWMRTPLAANGYSVVEYHMAHRSLGAHANGTSIDVMKCTPVLPKPIAVVGLYMYVFFFACGMGAIPWFIMGELFPIEVKGLATSICTAVRDHTVDRHVLFKTQISCFQERHSKRYFR